MKKFWVVLLSFGLIVAFGATAFAVDVKFDGEFYLQGWYNKNASLIDKSEPTNTAIDDPSLNMGRGSSAFYTQRLRMGMNFQVAKGLRFYTRFDALERKWMAARRDAFVSGKSPGYANTDQEAENIAWEVAYIQFFTKFGLFTIGNVPSTSSFGAPLGDNIGFSSGVMIWTLPKGPWTISAGYKKSTDGYLNTAMEGGTPIGGGTDNDSETYSLTAIYRWKGGATALYIGDVRSRTANLPHPNPTGTTNWVSRKTDIPFMSFWIQHKFGKIFIQEEFGMCHFGRYVQWNEPYTMYFPTPSVRDVDPYYAFTNYLGVDIDLAPAKVGFFWVVSRGDDPETMDKKEGGFRSVLDIDRAFNPCLILWNEDYMQWFSPFGTGGSGQGAGLIGNTTVPSASYPRGGNDAGVSTYVQNCWLYQLWGDYQVTPKLNIGGSFTYANAYEKPTDNGFSQAYGGKPFISDEYGYELDLTLKYKIFDNLEYMIGAAYLWTGDYFKGTNADVTLDDNYLITHKLTLTF